MFMVAGDWLCNRPDYRTDWLREILETYDLRRISNLPLCRPGVRRCQWLIFIKKRKYPVYFTKAEWHAMEQVKICKKTNKK